MVSGTPSIRFMHCTAAPEAPLPRLSKREQSSMRSLLPNTATSMASEPARALELTKPASSIASVYFTTGPGVFGGVDLFDILDAEAGVERPGEEGDGDQHPRVKTGHDGAENGGMHEPGDLCHLRQVLVLLREAVLAGGIERRRAALGLIIGDHALAAAGVAGE